MIRRRGQGIQSPGLARLTKGSAQPRVLDMTSFHVWTIGCQMNDADAARVHEGLSALGWHPVATSAEADLVVLLTCVVRQSAEDRVLGRLSSLKSLKRARPNAVLAVMGCFVGDAAVLKERFPYVEAFFRPSDVAGLLQYACSLVSEHVPLGGDRAPSRRGQQVCVMVPISYGCDHHCTYCIVRLRRGRQRSRPLPEIVQEVRALTERGAREVTLLGQNVDAYGLDLGTDGPDLADALTALSEIADLWRIRFLTSHPAHISDKLIDAVAHMPSVCPHFELPVQSGDDRVLQHMGRNYTVGRYSELVERIRRKVPGSSIATDVIVGFPGESLAEFQATVDLVSSTRFDAVHIAKYSPRSGTPAALLPDDVSPEEKERRRLVLEELQKGIARASNQNLLGQSVQVLVEDRQRGRWRGRTANNKLVFLEDEHEWRGRIANVRITWAGAWSLRGTAER